MLASAKRLTGDVQTDRFPWQSPQLTQVDTACAAVLVRALETRPLAPHVAELHEAAPLASIDEGSHAAEHAAFVRGRAEGEIAGRAAAAAEIQPVVETLTRTIHEIASLRASIVRRTERDVVKLALAMAERIVHRELTHDRALLLAMARVAIDQLGDQVVARIVLHPADFDTVTSSQEIPVPEGVTLAADPAMSRGGCRIESALGTIDAGVDAQIRELTRSLLGEPHDEYATPA